MQFRRLETLDRWNHLNRDQYNRVITDFNTLLDEYERVGEYRRKELLEYTSQTKALKRRMEKLDAVEGLFLTTDSGAYQLNFNHPRMRNITDGIVVELQACKESLARTEEARVYAEGRYHAMATQYNELLREFNVGRDNHTALKEQLASVSAQNDAQSAEISQLRASLAATEASFRSYVESATKEHEELQLHRSANRNIIQEWNARQSVHSFMSLGSENGPDYTYAVVYVLKENERIEALNGQLRSQNEELQKILGSRQEAQLKIRLATAEDNYNKCIDNLSAKIEENERSRVQLAEAVAENDRLRTNVSGQPLADTGKKHRHRTGESHGNYGGIMQELGDTINEAELTANQVKKMRTNYDDLVKTNESLNARIAILESEHAEQTKELGRLIEDAKISIDHWNVTYPEQKIHCETGEYTDRLSQIRCLLDSQFECVQQIGRVNAEWKKCWTEGEVIRAERDGLVERNAELSIRLEEQDRSIVTQRLDADKHRVRLEEEVRRVRDERDEITSTSQDLHQKLAQLRSESERQIRDLKNHWADEFNRIHEGGKATYQTTATNDNQESLRAEWGRLVSELSENEKKLALSTVLNNALQKETVSIAAELSECKKQAELDARSAKGEIECERALLRETEAAFAVARDSLKAADTQTRLELARISSEERDTRIRAAERRVELIEAELTETQTKLREVEAKHAKCDGGEPGAKRLRVAAAVPFSHFVVSPPSITFGSFY